jgi:hypothetical protein
MILSQERRALIDTMTCFLAAMIVLMSPAWASAETSPFEGVWILTTPGGPRSLEATLHVERTEMTGTIKLGGGAVVPISAGKVQGNRMSFNFPGENKRTLFFSGTLTGDVIEMELALGPDEYGSPYTGRRK